MSYRSIDHFEKQTNTEPLISSGFLQSKSSFDEQTFDGGKFADLYSPEHTFNSTSIGMSKAPGFGHDFSLIPTHSDMVRQAMPSLKTGTMVQRFPEPTTEETPPAPEAAPSPAAPEAEEESAAPEETAAPALIVEDSVTELSTGQMRKSEFLAQLRAAVISTAESAMAGTGRTTADCPYITFWFGYYSLRDAQHGERALRRYAPEASRATTASEYIPIITQRVRRSVETWVRTGEVTGVPEGISTVLPGAGLLGQIGSIFFKARSGGARRANNPRAIQSQLGSGRSLDSGVRSRMESAFGMDFSQVRTHTDTTAAGLSDRLNARAFTVGEHVAFGSGEYQPGTLFGDALIAHEMAHVVQQKGAGSSVASMQTGDTGYSMLEKDADKSAIGAVTSLFGKARGNLGSIARNAMPRLRSGLRLSRCNRHPCTSRTTAPSPEKTVTIRHSHLWGGSGTSVFTSQLKHASKVYKIAGIKCVAGNPETVTDTDTKAASLLGSNALLNDSGTNPQISSYTAEETALMSRNSAAGEITAYYIKGVENTPNLGGRAFLPSDGVIIMPSVMDRTLAHEIGHCLIGAGHPSNNDNIMAGNPSSTGVDCLSDDQIDDVRNSSLAR